MAMPISFSFSLLLVALITTSLPLIPTLEIPSPSQPPSLAATPLPPLPPLSTTQTPPTPSPTQAEIQENQLKNIIDALIGAGDFGGWANLLSSADSSAFPLTATLFIPSDDAAAHSASVTDTGISFDPFLIPYHIIPQRLTFSDLQQFAIHTRIQTLLPSKFIVITNNTALNFTVDDSQITQADIFSNAAFSVHGINNILDYSVYGGGGGGNLLSPPPENTDLEMPNPKVEPKKKKIPFFPAEITVGVRSSASCSCSGNLMMLSIIIFTQSSVGIIISRFIGNCINTLMKIERGKVHRGNLLWGLFLILHC